MDQNRKDEKRDRRRNRKVYWVRGLICFPFNFVLLSLACFASFYLVENYFGIPVITPEVCVRSTSVDVAPVFSASSSGPLNVYTVLLSTTLNITNPSGNHALSYTDIVGKLYLGEKPLGTESIANFDQLQSREDLLNLTTYALPVKVGDLSPGFCWDFRLRLDGNIAQKKEQGLEYNWGARPLSVMCQLGVEFSQRDGALEASSSSSRVCRVSVVVTRNEKWVELTVQIYLILAFIKISRVFDHWALHGRQWEWGEIF